MYNSRKREREREEAKRRDVWERCPEISTNVLIYATKLCIPSAFALSRMNVFPASTGSNCIRPRFIYMYMRLRVYLYICTPLVYVFSMCIYVTHVHEDEYKIELRGWVSKIVHARSVDDVMFPNLYGGVHETMEIPGISMGSVFFSWMTNHPTEFSREQVFRAGFTLMGTITPARTPNP